jgi:hypothetical protein
MQYQKIFFYDLEGQPGDIWHHKLTFARRLDKTF